MDKTGLKQQSNVIEWLRFTLAALVVFMHTPIIGVENYSENINFWGGTSCVDDFN